MPVPFKTLLAVLVIACAGFLAACGDDDEDSGSNGGGGGGGADTGGLTVTADESGTPAWEPTELTSPAGEVTVTLDNPSPVAHDIAIEGNGVEEKSELVTDDTTSVTADLEPGEYTYYCTVPGHEEAGMTGTLTVEP
jgi:plastocyanin